ncbi:hypothetical protein EYF80_043612 [Liparis tanakae]|uniref:Uncharacterized protein n=1 Tax=Liparis tanakae TaxID=230148 RepID=A0A4Z2FZW8_9TELE|nr:hypothetical protein EYF80_043612 [Liparis tanakae]
MKTQERGYIQDKQRDKDGDRFCRGTSTGVRTSGGTAATRQDDHRHDTPEPASQRQPTPPPG